MLTQQTMGCVVLIGLALSGCQRGSAPLTDADRNAITEGIAKLDKAVLAADPPGAVSVYTEDALLLPPNMPELRGRAAIQKFFEGFPKMSEFKENVVEVEGHGDLAYARATYRTAANPPGAKAPLEDTGKVLAIWRKQPDGSWLVTRAAWSSDLPPAR
jgi:uncharacterized protein (TIGR02246 family)